MKHNIIKLGFVFFIVTAHSLFGQNRNFKHIVGKVISTENKRITNATVFENGGAGTVTDNFGVFMLKSSNDTVVLSISHLQYNPIKQKVIFSDKKDTVFINITMVPKVEMLNEVSISANKVQQFYSDNKITILDYTISNDTLKVLLRKKRDYYLRIVVGGNVIRDWSLNFKPIKFYTDCFDNKHIYSDDTVCQLFVNNCLPQIVARVPVKKFKEIVEPCIINLDKAIVFKELGMYNQKVIYFSIDKETKKKQLLKIIEYKAGRFYASELRRDLIKHYMTVTPEHENVITNNMWNGDVFDLRSTNFEFSDKLHFYKKIAIKPIYCPIYKYNNGVLLFNHVSNEIEFFDSTLKQVKVLPIQYPKEDSWDSNIIETHQNDFYAQFINNGIVTLNKIDLIQGTITSSCTIEKYIFPEKIQIDNGYVYFFRKIKNTEDQELLRQKLD